MRKLLILLLFSTALMAQISRPQSYSDQAIADWMIDLGEFKRRSDLNETLENTINILRPYRQKISGNQYTTSSQAYADRTRLKTYMDRNLRGINDEWQKLGGYRLDFLDQIDCGRYVLAYYNASDAVSGTYIDEIRDEYNKLPMTYMMNARELKRDRRVRPNTHPLIDNVARGYEDNMLSRYWSDQSSEYQNYDDVQIKNSRDMDSTFRAIVFSLNKRNSKSTENEYLTQLYRVCTKEIKIDMYSSMMDRIRTIAKNLKTNEDRQRNIQVTKREEELSCQSYYQRARPYIRFRTDILGPDHEFFQKYTNEQLRSAEQNYNQARIFEYIGHALDKLPESEDVPALYTAIKDLRAMADVLFCAEYIEEDSEIIKNIDHFLGRSISDYHAKECSDTAFEEIEQQYYGRQRELAQMYDYLPSTGSTQGKYFERDFVNRMEKEKDLYIGRILDRVGKDFIDRAVKNLLVTSYMYGFDVSVDDTMQFNCEGDSTSTYCYSFKRYIQKRFTDEKETTIARLSQSSNHPQFRDCGGPGAIAQVNSLFSESELNAKMEIEEVVEREDGNGYQIITHEKRLVKNSSYGFRSVSSDHKEALTNAVFKRAREVANMREYRIMVPLMFSETFLKQFEIVPTDVFMTHGHPQAPPQVYYKTMNIQRVDASCSSLKYSLKEAMVKNVTTIANPTSFSKLFGFIEIESSSYKGIAESVGKFVAWFNPNETVDEVDQMFELMPGLKDHPKDYVKHLLVLLKHSEKDQYGRSIKIKYLNEFKGRSKFVCAIYDQIKHEKTKLDPYVNKQLEIFYAATKIVGILVAAAGWIFPPAGAAISTAVAFAMSTITSVAMITKYQSKLDSYLTDRNLALQSCVEDIVKTTPGLEEQLKTEEDKENYCDAVLELTKKVSKYEKKVKKYQTAMWIETGTYALYMLPLLAEIVQHAGGIKGMTTAMKSGLQETLNGEKLLIKFKDVGQKIGQWASSPPARGQIGRFLFQRGKGVVTSLRSGVVTNWQASLSHLAHVKHLKHAKAWKDSHEVINGLYNLGKSWKSVYYLAALATKGKYIAKITYLGLTAVEITYLFARLDDKGDDWIEANTVVNDPNAPIPDPPDKQYGVWEDEILAEMEEIKNDSATKEDYEKELQNRLSLNKSGGNY